MAAMTFDDMCIFVRAQADADTTTATTANLTVYARLAYNDILRRQNSWPHLEVAYTVSSVASSQNILLTGLSVTDMDFVTSIQDVSTGDRLFPIQQADADQIWNAQSKGNPAAYTIINQTLVLWPIPTGVRQYLVRGQRTEATWPNGAGSIPDLPTQFAEIMCLLMLHYYYLAQEDMFMANQYITQYNQLVVPFVASEGAKRLAARPSVMGANNRRFWTGAFVNRVKQWVE